MIPMKIQMIPVLLALATGSLFAQAKAPEGAPASTKTHQTHKAAKEAPAMATGTAAAAAKPAKGGPTMNASAADIANAKAKGLVWVNTGTGVYHKDGEYFGATKNGKFMTEAEAQQAKYRAAKDGGHAAKAAPAPKK